MHAMHACVVCLKVCVCKHAFKSMHVRSYEQYVCMYVRMQESASLLAGHYRAALCARGSIVSITDDGISAQPASEAEIQSVYRNSYIFILKRC